MLTSLLPPSVCAECRLCCNFMRESAWETPALEEGCAERLRRMGLSLQRRAEGGETLALDWGAVGAGKAANCPLLDTCQGCVLPREERPLECRLWPLRLMRDQSGRLVVACYRDCPGLARVPRETLVAHAESLRPVFEERVRSFPESIRPLHENYSVLTTL